MVKPTLEDFKIFFARDFPFQPVGDLTADPPVVVVPDPSKYVQDTDVSKAFMITNTKFNEEFFSTQEEYTLGYLYLSAHLLTMSIRASNAGFAGSFNWGSTSQSVGSVSVSNNLPESIAKNPLWAWLVSTNYGVDYLMMILPELVAPFGIAPGRTLA